VFGLRADVTRAATRHRLWALAETLLPTRCCGDFNQALMELGALVCTPVRPGCETCPLRSVCRARANGTVERLPNLGRRRVSVAVTWSAVLVRRGAKVLVRRRPGRGLLAGLWELPVLDPLIFRPKGELLAIRHTITKRRVTLRVVAAEARRPIRTGGRWRWITAGDLARLAFSAAHRRALEQLFLPQHQDWNIGHL
jgi:A/G-specific adenine glycosylase